MKKGVGAILHCILRKETNGHTQNESSSPLRMLNGKKKRSKQRFDYLTTKSVILGILKFVCIFFFMLVADRVEAFC